MSDKPDSVVSIRVPYKNLKHHAPEVEMVNVDDDTPPKSRVCNADSPPIVTGHSHDLRSKRCSLLTLILSCTVAAGVQFGWALQLSLLTPYVQTLGVGHAFSSFIWLCGPITGLVVQPCVGIWSDKCTSKYGRRRPFILAGSIMISAAVIIIGFSADIGYWLGDTKEHCSTFKGTRTRATFIFIIGFWLLDLANNTVQGPARALLADLSGPDQWNAANAVFASWMAVGNILGFLSGASGNWHKWFPFLTNRACCEACGNLKAAFLVAVVVLTFCTIVTLYFAKEVSLESCPSQRSSDSAPLLDDLQDANLKSHDSFSVSNTDNVQRNDDNGGGFSDGPGAVMVKLLTSLRHLPPAMHSVLLVTGLTWVSWFPFLLFDTDWMGREVYHGNPIGSASEVNDYNQGVREGAIGLLLNSVFLGVGSFLIEPMCRRMGTKVVWALSNFVVFFCMAGIAVLSFISLESYSQGVQHVIVGNSSTKIVALVIFAILGFPLSITYSVPYSVTATVTADSGGGQGLALGVLNLAIVVPQGQPGEVVEQKELLHHHSHPHHQLYLFHHLAIAQYVYHHRRHQEVHQGSSTTLTLRSGWRNPLHP